MEEQIHLAKDNEESLAKELQSKSNEIIYEKTETEEETINEDETSQLEYIFKIISENLLNITSSNKQIKISPNISPIFNINKPLISIYDYLCRINRYSSFELSTYIVSLIYLDRICKEAKIFLTPYNIHKLLFTSILIAAKYNEDKLYTNSHYAKIAGVSTKELINMENCFLFAIKFKLYIDVKTYQEYSSCLNYNNDD